MAKGLFMVVSAPSGTGKSSICDGLTKACPGIKFSVSHTSRAPRPGEQDGKDYYFVSKKEFQQKIKAGEFIEWVENYSQYYGSSRKEVENVLHSGKDVLFDIEPRGAKKIKETLKGGIYVFILPPSKDELLNRLRKRGHETEDVIQKRFKQAESEIKEISWYDYVIINKDLKMAIRQLIAIYIAEKCRRKRLSKEIKQFNDNF
ncbi:MAG: guanylate kinase [Smithella sp.]|nr:guanylate kinase [Smithella sp.]